MGQGARRLVFAIELIVLAGLILTTRCMNYRDVFVRNHIYFADADCYARMTRVRLCARQPGLILRHHGFENFPQGTTPHTTAPLDYAILILRFVLRPFTARSIDMAGAFISPVFAVITGVFLCWWSRQMRLPFRWAMLILFAVSPILVHASALGRPDHQSLVLLLVIAGICADCIPKKLNGFGWSITSGLAWGLGIWVSAYEPLILFIFGSLGLAATDMILSSSRQGRRSLTDSLRSIFTSSYRQARWASWAAVLICALLVERRFPSLFSPVRRQIFHNWSRTIGELAPVPLINPIWFSWVGLLIVAAPVLWWWRRRDQTAQPLPLILTLSLVLTFSLTMWQARWGYFFAGFFAMTLPHLLAALRWRVVAWTLFVCSLWPVLREWDSRIWPDDLTAARQLQQRRENVDLRELSLRLISNKRQAFLAPWWLSPAIAYWSGQPGVAGSSHESLPGILDSVAFFLTEGPAAGAEILRRREVTWLVVSDAESVTENGAAILGKVATTGCMGRVLDQRPSYAPSYVVLITQTGSHKLFRVANSW